LFAKARKKAPAIIFIDEIDSIAGKRKAMDAKWSRETLNQILSEMDGFKQTDNIIVVGATNLEEGLDHAIKRPGRFDKTIHIPAPDVKGREDIFKYYLGKVQVEGGTSSQPVSFH
jgi:ATP-dependent metalloprotease